MARRMLADATAPERINERVWRVLVREAEMALWERDPDEKGRFDAVLARYRTLEHIIEGEGGKRSRERGVTRVMTSEPDARYKAVMTMVHARMCADPLVRNFREDVWPGRPFTHEEACQWMIGRAEVEAPSADGGLDLHLPGAYSDLRRFLSEHEPVASIVPGDRVRFRPFSRLGRLYFLVRRWQLPTLFDFANPARSSEGDAVAAILCDTMQMPDMVSATAFVGNDKLVMIDRVIDGKPYNTGVINLTVNVRTPVAELVRVFEQFRAEGRVPRDHPMQTKHIELAIFTDGVRQQELGWLPAQRRWNEAHPEWPYPEDAPGGPRRFARDCRAAWERVTGTKWFPAPYSIDMYNEDTEKSLGAFLDAQGERS